MSNDAPADLPPQLLNRLGAREVSLHREPDRWKRMLRILGPGVIAGASDDDPATIGTCASVGAAVGYRPCGRCS